MSAIEPWEKQDIAEDFIVIAPKTRIRLVVAVVRAAATATIAVSRIDGHTGVRTWQISNDDFMASGGRVVHELTLREGDQFQIDFFAYAAGEDAEVLFKMIDGTGADRYRQYSVNNGEDLFDPWGAIGVVTTEGNT